MKRLMLATVALSLLATPAALASDWYCYHLQPRFGMQFLPAKPFKFWQPELKKQHWKKGQRLSHWEQRQAFYDWKYYGLRRPGHGQQWIRIGNDYLLIVISTGLVAGFIAAN
jgi:Ni/Co efflux regulator RcnB